MRSEGLARRVPPSELPEWMDGESTYEAFRDCLADLSKINRVTLTFRPSLDFLQRIWKGRPEDEALHIVDVGCGGGDFLRQVAAAARRQRRQVTLTGIDLNPYAARAARESGPESDGIAWVTGDAFALGQGVPVDVIFSSLFAHHLEDAEIVRYLRWSEQTARLGWFINDLYRSAEALRFYPLLVGVMRLGRFVRHDGAVSFRRAFREADWKQYLAEAGLQRTDARVAKWFPARLCVERLK